MHALGHAGLAIAAGGCAQALAGGAGGTGLLAPGSTGALLGHRIHGGALSLAVAGLVAVTLKGMGGAWASWEQAQISGDVGGDLRLRALDGWLARHRLRRPRHDDHGRADDPDAERAQATSPASALAALTHHVRELETGLDTGVLGAVRALVQLAPLAVLLGLMAPRLALVAGLTFGVFALVLGRTRKAWKRANERAARHREALLEAADEAVRHAELWTTYGAEGRVRQHLGSIGRALAKQGARIEGSAAALSGANEVLGALALVLAILAGGAGWLGSVGGAGAGEAVLLPFAVTFFLAYRPIRDLTDARLSLARASVAGDSLAGLLLEADEQGVLASGDLRAWPLAPLEIDGLVLGRGLAGAVSVRVAPGSVLAIVGATGSGKTTLLRTLLGLDDPRAGTIRYGASRLETLPSGPASRPFAWVPQDAPILADTLAANVSLAPGSGDPHAALAAIGAGDLAKDVGTARLGAGGRPLSGGERQWVALARAVATRLPVLLLDEPTSGLDPASQARVLDAIARLKGSRTVILVTHREEPLAIADAVLHIATPPEEQPTSVSRARRA